ncbi:MAG: response regulator [Gemmatimonadales bacterium]|nr:response regulator [Gemmatimonadales bacterium]
MAKKVLIVDDDKNTVTFLSLAMTEGGYEAIGAFDGKEGLEKVEQEMPDLIILDVMMPQKSGFVLFKQLRKDKKYRDIPVIMLTGVVASLHELDERKDETFESPYESMRDSLRKTIAAMQEEGEAGPEVFIEKPVDPEDVVGKVRELIGG